MSVESSVEFTKENIDAFLEELGREFFLGVRDKNAHVEIILVGGAAVMTGFGFRQMTQDVDALLQSPRELKEAIKKVGRKHGIDDEWMNDHFVETSSVSNKLVQYSRRYKVFCRGRFEVRSVKPEFLVAMKLRASRVYKRDLSDIVGIFAEMQVRNTPLTTDAARSAYEILYGDRDIPSIGEDTLKRIEETDDLYALYNYYVDLENSGRSKLLNEEEQQIFSDANNYALLVALLNEK